MVSLLPPFEGTRLKAKNTYNYSFPFARELEPGKVQKIPTTICSSFSEANGRSVCSCSPTLIGTVGGFFRFRLNATRSVRLMAYTEATCRSINSERFSAMVGRSRERDHHRRGCRSYFQSPKAEDL